VLGEVAREHGVEVGLGGLAGGRDRRRRGDALRGHVAAGRRPARRDEERDAGAEGAGGTAAQSGSHCAKFRSPW
jgi:hypothetical protein